MPTIKKSISILMCTYNGEAFLKEQLASFKRQTHKNWKLFVSDDGSNDSTLKILEHFKKELGTEKVTILKGPQKGFQQNFLSLITSKNINSSYYAYADQDDIWFENKLEHAISVLNQHDPEIPALYGSKTILVDSKGSTIGYSSNFKRKPCFQNALVQNISGGNTMVINHPAKKIIQENSLNINIVSHDWWTYQVISAIGGNIIFDRQPSLYYRQHDRNVISANNSLKGKLSRISSLFKGVYLQWNNQNIKVLEKIEPLMTEKNKQTYLLFKSARKKTFFLRLIGLYKSGVFRQNSINHLSLILGSILGKV